MQYMYSNTDIVTNIRNQFLTLNRQGDFLDTKLFKDKYVIYMIENLLDHKIYIGKTVGLLNRANNYIYNYRTPTTNIHRSINKDISELGIQNFRMFPIDIADTREELAKLERDYILEYNTCDPAIGYNDVIPSGLDIYSKNYKSGTPHSIETKMKKAKLVACIDPDKKVLFISIGMKLFGDLVESSKDQVKNCARRGIRHRGFYVIYLNNFDRELIRNSIIKKQNEYDRRNAQLKIYNPNHCGYNNGNNYDTYLSNVNQVEILLDEQNADDFISSGYNCYFLSYNQESESPTYLIKDIDEFFDLVTDQI